MSACVAKFERRGSTSSRIGCALILATTCLPASIVAAQSTQPAGRFEGQPVRAAQDLAAPTTNRSAVSSNAIPPIHFDWQRVAFALALVLALIAVLRFAGKRLFGATAAIGAGRTIRVLGRATTAPRQQVVLLQIGKRIVVAADNGGQLSSLCQITDADEVAALLGQLDESTTASPRSVFTNWFKKASEDFNAEDAEPEQRIVPAGAGTVTEDISIESARGEIAGLMDRVRAMTRQMRK